ncbi:hypothetical protein Y1Q_0010828 [Alligator mississippiensis]|uniref:Uncharacterized protein n=1 Tax=Alligator mississippiensis TaxID=8496 RepID=A0A151M6Z1_ALLMI|nr:hypothetical protein Y1Q_0010828 [Alligator mississippiensis]
MRMQGTSQAESPGSSWPSKAAGHKNKLLESEKERKEGAGPCCLADEPNNGNPSQKISSRGHWIGWRPFDLHPATARSFGAS